MLAKFYTQRWPRTAILMEIAWIMLSSDAYMAMSHFPSEREIWADAFANFDTTGFNPTKRCHPLEELKENGVLTDLLFWGEQMGFHLTKKQREEHKKKLIRLTPASLLQPFQGRPAKVSPIKKRRTS